MSEAAGTDPLGGPQVAPVETPAGPMDPGTQSAADRQVSGGDADRMDPAGPGTGGMQAGADGETGAREQLRKDLGERDQAAGTEDGAELEQDAALGETDDPQGGSIQERGSTPG